MGEAARQCDCGIGLDPLPEDVNNVRRTLTGDVSQLPNLSLARAIAAAPRAQRLHMLQNADSDSTRLLALDMLSPHRVHVAQHMDDGVCPASSPGATQMVAEAVRRQAANIGQVINRGDSKTSAFMAPDFTALFLPIRCQEVLASWRPAADVLGYPFCSKMDGGRVGCVHS